jgi:hypothetical protein
MCGATTDVCFGPIADIRLCPKAKSATWGAPRWGLAVSRAQVGDDARHPRSGAVAAFIREGLTVARSRRRIGLAQPPGGIKKKKGSTEITVPEFAMPPDAVPGIAQVIVDIWQGIKPGLE